jgi:hypothetical protein
VWIIISVLVLRGVPDKLLLLSSLVRISESLLPRGWCVLLFLFAGVVSSVSPDKVGTQGGCRREWLRAKETDAKWRQGCQAFLLFLINS